MRFVSSNGNYAVVMDEEIYNGFKESYNTSILFDEEFGGVLIGKYSGNYDTAHIKEIIVMKNIHEKPSTGYERKAFSMQDFQDMNPEYHYIGEWHTHPNNSPKPSEIDKDEMLKFAEKNGDSDILLVIGENYELSITVHTTNGLHYLKKEIG